MNNDILMALALGGSSGGSSGGGGVLVVHRDETNMVLDKTFSEIYTAMLAGTIPCVLKSRSEGQNRVHLFSYIFAAGILNGEYVLKAYAPTMAGETEYEEYWASAEDEYPEF